ncbi:MAG: alpha-ketoacid dehydrogenase subunit beta [Anaerolineaceae bacterium]
MREIRYREALTEALHEEMLRDEKIIILGEDVGVYGGIFKVTNGFLDEFGPARVMDTPIAENAIMGLSAGAAMLGQRPVLEIMYMDFFTLALDQLVNGAAALPFVYGGQVEMPLVIRTQGGAGSCAGAQHSKSLEAWIAHIPGVRVAMPSTPFDAKGLLKSAIQDKKLTVVIEHKQLYNTRGPVPEEEYTIPFGKADVKRRGTDITVIATSRMVLEALSAAEMLSKDGIDIEVVDPRSLRPLDKKTILESVAHTHRAMVVHEAWRTGGFGAEIAAMISEEGFDYLDGPVTRLAGTDIPIPYSPALEPHVIPNAETIAAQIRKVLK